jgi:DNA (cytosine-5)-methyltransferase 1
LKHGSLFSGIGGFDLAAEWMGWENVFHCEIAEFPRKILNYYWPKSESYEDIKKTDFTKWCGTVDIISGGFPCQPYSSAGKRLGKEDDRHLWPEMLRVIREVKPQWVVGENVRGLLNWNGGLVFHEVCTDLENIGYEVQAFVISASGVNAPHQRERLWVVAHSNGNECNKRGQKINGRKINKFKNGNDIWDKFTPDGKQRDATDTDSRGLEGTVKVRRNCEYVIGENGTSSETGDVANSDLHGFNECNGNDEINASERGFDALNDIKQDVLYSNISIEPRQYIGQHREGKFNRPNSGNGFDNFQNFPTQSPVRSGDDGISHRLDNITFSKWRNESIKGYGNAVVPQVVYRIFKTIEYIQSLK